MPLPRSHSEQLKTVSALGGHLLTLFEVKDGRQGLGG
jgi:hypothetical protein